MRVMHQSDHSQQPLTTSELGNGGFGMTHLQPTSAALNPVLCPATFTATENTVLITLHRNMTEQMAGVKSVVPGSTRVLFNQAKTGVSSFSISLNDAILLKKRSLSCCTYCSHLGLSKAPKRFHPTKHNYMRLCKNQLHVYQFLCTEVGPRFFFNRCFFT